MSGPVVKPTKGESLYLWRRRRGLNQAAAAAELGASVDTYREWEAGTRSKDQPRQLLGQLKPHEVCLLRRRRLGMTQKDLAKAMSCTRLWVIQMESGAAPAERLREHWRV